MKILKEDEIEKKAEKFLNDLGKRDNAIINYYQVNCLRRVNQHLGKELFTLFLDILLIPLYQIKKTENDILTDLNYSIKEHNKNLFKMDKDAIEKIESMEDCFNSHAHYLYFYYDSIRMGLK